MTEDGTEFKGSMISGGTHTNIFNINLGNFKMDKEIQKLTDDVSKLEKKLQKLRLEEKGDELLSLNKEIAKEE